tara:strand:- start:1052 stop:2038 length:987 start_codon:yes stop_codon:yes gene_type:complete
MFSKIKNILVTGGAGYIGSHIVETLIKKNLNIYILDNLITGSKKLIDKKSIFIEGDIGNTKKVNEIIRSNKIDTIIHLAAYLNVTKAEINKKAYKKNNINGTLSLVKACKNTNVKNIIFSSSCSIYGNIKGSVNEKKKPNPKGYYAYTKYKGEKIIQKYAKQFEFKYIILRYFNIAGASTSGKIGEIEKSYGHLIKNLAIQSIRKKPIVSIYGKNYKTKDGTCIRDYMHISDLVDIHVKVLKYLQTNTKSLVLNCGYGKGYSVLDIVNIFKTINKNLKINFKPRRIGDVAQIYADIKKIQKILKWKPKYNSISKILLSAFKWEKFLKH